MDLADISELIPLSRYRDRRHALFPTPWAMDWFIRRYRDELVATGGLLKINREWWVHQHTFDGAVLAIGKRAAQGKQRQRQPVAA